MDKKKLLELKQLFSSEDFEQYQCYDGDDLGAVYTPEKTDFKVWAPMAEEVCINFYTAGSDEETGAEKLGSFPMNQEKQGIWHYCEKKDMAGVYYTYSILQDGKLEETGDIYAKACGVNGIRSMVIDFSKTNPKGWEEEHGPMTKDEEKIIYEVHIKDFSSDVHSGIQDGYRGKYMAFTQKDSTLNQDGIHPTCLSYLKKLGIGYVHILPAYDFGSVDESKNVEEQFNWGYDPVNYNCPEGSYSTDPFHGEVRIREFKEMVKSLHEEGIGVIMDVVYNHTFQLDSWFQKTVPYYYYRMNDRGELTNGSACGNDTASERKMYRKYMIESVLHWAKEYHIDGFRFDLMGLHDVETMNAIRKALNQLPGGERILMYGEPWAGGESPMEHGAIPALKANVHLLDENISIFCDNTRDSIKGSVFLEQEPGFVNTAKVTLMDRKKIEHSVRAWCGDTKEFSPKSPRQIISYVSSHDNFSLWDKLVLTSGKQREFNCRDEKLLRLNKMCAGIVFTCQGIPFFQAGEEFGRTKQGIGDSYKTSSDINQLDWKRAYEYEELVEYYRKLISIRKEFPIFSSFDKKVSKNIKFFNSKKVYLAGFSLWDERAQKELLVYYNAGWSPERIGLPDGKWRLVLGDVVKSSEIYINKLTMEGKTVVILCKE